jgi:hypothetical protein
MKRINLPFEDWEMKIIKEAKGNKTWRTYMLDNAKKILKKKGVKY